jgi:drug/metabolite transporter (DMT)-like permease
VTIRPRLLVLAAAVLFSTGGLAIKGTALDGWQVAGLRSGFAALAIALIVPAARRHLRASVMPVALVYGATLVLFTLANKYTTAANAIFIQDTAPVYVLMLGPVLLGEQLRRSDALFVLVMASGMALFFVGTEPVQATAPDPELGNALAVASSLTWALTLIGLRALGRRGEHGTGPPAAAALIGNVLACVLCLPMMLPWTPPTAHDWLTVAYLGVFQVGLAYALLVRATSHVRALDLSLLLLLEPVLNPIWAYLGLGERPGGFALLGGAIVLGASFTRAIRNR